MKGKILNSICAVLTAAACTVPVWAEPMTAAQAAEALVEADDSHSLRISNGSDLRFMRDIRGYELEDATNAVFRSSDIYTYIGYGTVYEITADQLERMAYEDDYVTTWCRENVPNIVADKLSIPAAVKCVYDWISDTMPYDHDALSSDRVGSSEQQSAYTALTKSKAICASYSKLFRAMIETIPFNGTGNVDWVNGTEHLKVSVIDCMNGSVGHEWAAITSYILSPLWVVGNDDTTENLSQYVNAEETLYFDLTQGDEGFAISETTITDFLARNVGVSDKSNWYWFN